MTQRPEMVDMTEFSLIPRGPDWSGVVVGIGLAVAGFAGAVALVWSLPPLLYVLF